MKGRAVLLAAACAVAIAGRPMAATAPSAPTTAAKQQTRDQGVLEVTSDRDLEWLQQDHAYIARGNAVAKRGSVTVTGDILIAYYRSAPKPTPAGMQAANAAQAGAGQPDAGQATAAQTVATQTNAGVPAKEGFDTGDTEIWRVVAEGHAHISSEGRDAYGDRMEYDKDTPVVIMTGGDLKGVTPDETITARDSLEYWPNQDMAVARGDAVITKVNGDRLEGDVIGAHFVKDATGHTTLKTIEAKGHVIITTASDIVHGDEGTYDLEAKRTVIFGDVRATRGESQLEGASAEVNMDTGISQVFPAPGRRVRGLFVSAKKEAADKGQPTKAGGQPTKAGRP
jgi:lipopolysaccharide export system protein LptA